jgi:hypothetical protein
MEGKPTKEIISKTKEITRLTKEIILSISLKEIRSQLKEIIMIDVKDFQYCTNMRISWKENCRKSNQTKGDQKPTEQGDC